MILLILLVNLNLHKRSEGGGEGTASSHLSDGACRAEEAKPWGEAAVKALFCLQMLIVLDSDSFLSLDPEIIKQKTYSL